MAEDAGEKTEAPTAKRVRDAREEGNVARSQDLAAAILILAGAGVIWAGGPIIARSMIALFRRCLGGAGPIDAQDLGPFIARALYDTAWALLPILGGLMVAAVLANLVQVGFLLSGKRLTPDLANLSPIKGFSKLFGKGRGPVHLLMSFAKLGAVGYVAYAAVRGRMADIVSIQQLDFVPGFGLAFDILLSVTVRIGVALLVLAFVDFAYQKWRNTEQLKMTKQELKREMQESDGDPHVKARRRQIARQQAMRRVEKDVPTADVVVTNPTHFAVALKYDDGRMRAPVVVAKGADLIAKRIRELAMANRVPVVERKPLARALYEAVKVGEEIPEDLYAAVAEILAYVYELDGKASASRTATVASPSR